MTIRAYNEIYLESAQSVVGHMFDFAVNENGIAGDEYAIIFAGSACAKEMERGNPTYVAGKTGPEVARIVLEAADYPISLKEDVMYADRSPEYWAGWSLAYYQWYSDKSYKHLFAAVPFSDLIKMYPVYHEMDVEKFVEEMDRRLKKHFTKTPLEIQRGLMGLSREELAHRAGVTASQIRMFETGEKDIRHAQAQTLLRISKALSCSIEKLL